MALVDACYVVGAVVIGMRASSDFKESKRKVHLANHMYNMFLENVLLSSLVEIASILGEKNT